MAIRFEITVNDEKPIVAGFTEQSYGLVASISAAHYPDGASNLGVNVGGMVRDTRKSVNWLNQDLKAGDEIRIRILEEGPISEPIQNTAPNR